MEFIDRFTLGDNVTMIISDGETQVFQVRNNSGEGIMTLHQIFSGVYLIFNDFHMENFFSGVTHDTSVFCVDHCREGRIEHVEENGNHCYIESGDLKIDHIFSELYFVPYSIKNYYYKIKIIELLLYLDALEISDHNESKPYFYKTQVEKVKAMKKFMTDQLERRYTLDDLSERFNISLTSMKKCFDRCKLFYSSG